jgi:hypothetical protein
LAAIFHKYIYFISYWNRFLIQSFFGFGSGKNVQILLDSQRCIPGEEALQNSTAMANRKTAHSTIKADEHPVDRIRKVREMVFLEHALRSCFTLVIRGHLDVERST